MEFSADKILAAKSQLHDQEKTFYLHLINKITDLSQQVEALKVETNWLRTDIKELKDENDLLKRRVVAFEEEYKIEEHTEVDLLAEEGDLGNALYIYAGAIEGDHRDRYFWSSSPDAEETEANLKRINLPGYSNLIIKDKAYKQKWLLRDTFRRTNNILKAINRGRRDVLMPYFGKIKAKLIELGDQEAEEKKQ